MRYIIKILNYNYTKFYNIQQSKPTKIKQATKQKIGTKYYEIKIAK